MKEVFAGKTKLGKSLNNLSNKTDGVQTQKLNVRHGIIVESVGGTYAYKIRILKVRVDDNGGFIEETDFITGPMSLSEPVNRLASEASPDDLVGARVSIQYFGDSPERGRVFLISNSFGADKTDETLQATQLPVKGTAFARPGVSLI